MVNSLPKKKKTIFDSSRLKASEDKLKELNMMIFVFERVENIVGKGENAGYQHFLLFPQCFQEAFYLGLLKIRIVW